MWVLRIMFSPFKIECLQRGCGNALVAAQLPALFCSPTWTGAWHSSKHLAPKMSALWGSDCVEHVILTEGAIFQAYFCAGQVHCQQRTTVLPRCLTNGV